MTATLMGVSGKERFKHRGLQKSSHHNGQKEKTGRGFSRMNADEQNLNHRGHRGHRGKLTTKDTKVARRTRRKTGPRICSGLRKPQPQRAQRVTEEKTCPLVYERAFFKITIWPAW